MIGDGIPTDMAAARAVGARCVFMLTGVTTRAEWWRCRPISSRPRSRRMRPSWPRRWRGSRPRPADPASRGPSPPGPSRRAGRRRRLIPCGRGRIPDETSRIVTTRRAPRPRGRASRLGRGGDSGIRSRRVARTSARYRLIPRQAQVAPAGDRGPEAGDGLLVEPSSAASPARMAVLSMSIARPCAPGPIRSRPAGPARRLPPAPPPAALGSAYGALRALIRPSASSRTRPRRSVPQEGTQARMSISLLAKSLSMDVVHEPGVAGLEPGHVDLAAEQRDDGRCAFHRQPGRRFDLELVERSRTPQPGTIHSPVRNESSRHCRSAAAPCHVDRSGGRWRSPPSSSTAAPGRGSPVEAECDQCPHLRAGRSDSTASRRAASTRAMPSSGRAPWRACCP